MSDRHTRNSTSTGLRIYQEPHVPPSVCTARLLVVGDPGPACGGALASLAELGVRITTTFSRGDAESLLQNQLFDAVLHIVADREAGIAGIQALTALAPTLPHVVAADAAHHAALSESLHPLPFLIMGTDLTVATLQSVLYRAVTATEAAHEQARLTRQLALRGTREIVGHSRPIETLRRRIVQLAEADHTVLIHGESGTGKQLAARVLHDCGPRAYRPLVSVDCALLTAAHLERELFGDAATPGFGGGTGRRGRLELAAGGTLVLLNIDEMALMLQADLAQVLREKRFRRLGANDYCSFDAQIISTTRFDLGQHARQGLFREDLLDEIAEATVTMPPLRECRDDIATLTEHFLRHTALKQGVPPRRLTATAVDLLSHYHWPGNVRELENLIAHACTIDNGSKLTPELVRPWLATPPTSDGSEADMTLKAMERKLIESTFARYAGNREKTAQALQIGLRTLSGKLREYGYPPRGGPGSNHPRKRAA